MRGLHLLCKCCGVYGHVARNCTKVTFRHENGNKNVSDNIGNIVKDSAPEKPTAAELPSNNILNMERADVEAEIKGDDIYGDWLVVDRKRNKGRKSRPKTQQELANVQGGIFKNFNDKNLNFSQLNDVGQVKADGASKQDGGPYFHPGGSYETPKVWSKKNKRARGMTTNIKRPTNTLLKNNSLQPGGKELNPAPVILKREGRVGANIKPDTMIQQPRKLTETAEIVFDASRLAKTHTQNDETRLKPPDLPIGTGIMARATDDEMVVETPTARG
ncbi:hypothetical protein TSUD_215670 [Trifolium subterraneum]|uniref:CCHC-type domain-containing protein n=1 Tax=Trifolium subterraneum TaxID=3900 RepID=A0A2Z6M6I3_TRISU|nr:hypothetical protein TSUD_215670 [Trifolium subterraneum]